MPREITDEALAFILARAGLEPTATQKAGLKRVYPELAALIERVRRPRSIMAEPAHIFGFAEEDLR